MGLKLVEGVGSYRVGGIEVLDSKEDTFSFQKTGTGTRVVEMDGDMGGPCFPLPSGRLFREVYSKIDRVLHLNNNNFTMDCMKAFESSFHQNCHCRATMSCIEGMTSPLLT